LKEWYEGGEETMKISKAKREKLKTEVANYLWNHGYTLAEIGAILSKPIRWVEEKVLF